MKESQLIQAYVRSDSLVSGNMTGCGSHSTDCVSIAPFPLASTLKLIDNAPL